MKIAIAAIGTTGDLAPLESIATSLISLGHDVFLILNPADTKDVTLEGANLIEAGKYLSVSELFKSTPELFTAKGENKLLKLIWLPQIEAFFYRIKDLIQTNKIDLVISHFLCFGAEWAACECQVKHINIHVAPKFLFSKSIPSVSRSSKSTEKNWKRSIKISIHKYIFGKYLDIKLDKIARKIDFNGKANAYFEPRENTIYQIAMWSDKFRGRANDDPENLVYSGFPSSKGSFALDEEVTRFLIKNPSPVVVGFGGSASNIADDLYSLIANVCTELQLPCLLCGASTGDSRYENEFVKTCGYAPYEPLFRTARLIIHHGGMGVCAFTLNSGKPSITIPFFGDQFDNAFRLSKMGSSKTIRREFVNHQSLKALINEILQDSGLLEKAKLVKSELDGDFSGALKVAKLVNEISSKHQ